MVGVVRPWPVVSTVPVDPGLVRHIEADEDYPRGAPLDRQIESLEPGVPPSSYLPRLPDEEIIHVSLALSRICANLDLADAGKLRRNLIGKLQTGKVRQAPYGFPPRPVATVDNIRPRAEFDVFLDGKDAGNAPQSSDVCFLG